MLLSGMHHVQERDGGFVLDQDDDIVFVSDKLLGARDPASSPGKFRIRQFFDLIVNMEPQVLERYPN